FARVAAGLVTPASGEVTIDGRAVRTGSVRQARQAGVELVHQSFALPPSFTVAEAMEFGASGHSGLFGRSALERRWKAHLDSVDVKVEPRKRIRDLPVETQQGVEIARALVTDARVLILDEPTAVLSPSGIETLFERVRRLKARGVTVILILHKIREVLAVADTVTVLRAGRLVEGPIPCAGVEPSGLAEMIIGNAAANILSGGIGNDTLNGGAGKDTLNGGAGNDVYHLYADTTDVIIDASGVDAITSTISRSLAGYASIENLTLLGTAAINGTGNALNNVIIGNAAANVLSGGAGKDTLNGGAGNDTY
ncbi:ATP-binding cassette domain-containing protein, partial [Rhizobiaceae sp. 2RAB30]